MGTETPLSDTLKGLDMQRLGDCKLFICKAARACPHHPYIESLPTLDDILYQAKVSCIHGMF